MKKWQVYVVVISLFVHLAASRVETIIEGRTGEITNKLFDGIRGRRTVEIINKLGGGLTLTLHCKSKDDDLGVQTLAPDSRWSFKFTPAFFGTTRFSCNFKWGGESHSFDIYDDDRDVGDKQCYLCSWNIYNGSQGGFTCRFQESTEEEDLLRFMIKEEVDLVFPMFDGAAETGKITRKAFTEWVVSLLKHFLALCSYRIVIAKTGPECK
ncbi:hypothetical protein HID58_045570 [Brassica napus]|uniref:S-protein homolog n=1 Tax=Brassica napus TaxID=3708 RepID=A0ABQ8AUP9_BRANA|nr:hypothetical protein HID58_045570 [Brassica napus]